MTFLQMLLLAIVQGVTEFLPISSSGHLILLPVFTGYADQGPMIDIAVHVGSLLAIITYFFKDVWSLGRGGLASVGVGQAPAERRLFWFIIIGTIPAVIVGLFLKTGGYLDGFSQHDTGRRQSDHLRHPARYCRPDWPAGQKLRGHDAQGRHHCRLGPGTGIDPRDQPLGRNHDRSPLPRLQPCRSRPAFSFLLSIPAVAGAGVLIIPDLMDASTDLLQEALITGALTFLAALATMAFLMQFLRKASMMVFVIYRVAMGIALLALF